MRAVVFGKNGGLACAITKAFLRAGWKAEQVARDEASPTHMAGAYVFCQGVFYRQTLLDLTSLQTSHMVNVGLLGIIERLQDCLHVPVEHSNQRVDYCLIGSTSSYAGYANSSVYCAVKFGLLGLVRALNEEYKDTNRRFWLFSPGTMDTEMGRQLTDQDPSTFLSPDDIAERIVSAITNPSNLFEPEVVLRRRTIA